MEPKLICRGYNWNSHTLSSNIPGRVAKFDKRSHNLVCRGYVYQNSINFSPSHKVSHAINWRYLPI